jgi:Zn finger protein HypA/HybF involved in hydrogenase expression
MHELSIAEAILDLAREHVPTGKRLTSVTVRAGRLRAIDHDAMELAWAAVTDGGDAVSLDLQLSPWTLRCGQCGRSFESDEHPAACTCGSGDTVPVGTDELQLLSIDVD